mmetsp:Transcript_120927/g.337455  ORF Transcript_120927/g.337455 Transcript_120927/m.337455 type:complete len:426 (+) Transcript_120927:1780-3057(+)
MQQQVDRRHARLLAVRHEHDHRLVRRVVLDGLVDRPAHGEQPRRAVVDVEALDDHFQRHCSDIRREVEEASAAGTNPFANVFGVSQGGRQSNNADGLLHLHGDVAHAADHRLQRRPDVAVQEVQLIHHKEAHLLDALPRLPAAAHQVPLLGGRDYDVGLLQDLDVTGRFTHKFCHFEAENFAKLVGPLIEALLRSRWMRRHVHAALHGVRIAQEHAHYGELGADRFAARRRCADQAIVVRRVEGAERLRLDGVEDLQPLRGVELLCLRVPQCRERQGLEVKQLCVRWVLLWQDQVPEGHRQERLGVDPAVGDHADEVLRWQWLRDGHREVQRVLFLGTALLEHKHLLVQNLFAVDVLHEDPEGLRAPVHARVPLEVWGDRQLHHEAGSRNGLHVGAEVQLGELVHQFVDGLPHLGEPDQLTNLSA